MTGVPPRVMIADDEEDICSRLKEELVADGYEVLTAANGKEALKLSKANKFDLAIIDIVMPEVDGIAVLKSIKQDSPNTKVIMLTGYPNVYHAIESKKHGAEEFMGKPFSIDELKQMVKYLLDR